MYRFTNIITLIAAFTFHAGTHAHSSNLKQLFRRPLIMGASVSSGMLTDGPATIATVKVMGQDTSYNIARHGARGKYFTNLSPKSLSEFSTILAIDFLFWDSTHEDVSESLAALENLVKSARQARVPLILGDIPDLHFFQNEPSRIKLNAEIRKHCRRAKDCYIVELEKMHQEATSQGIVLGKYLYSFFDLTFDGLHVNRIGSDYLAQKIMDLLASRK